MTALPDWVEHVLDEEPDELLRDRARVLVDRVADGERVVERDPELDEGAAGTQQRRRGDLPGVGAERGSAPIRSA